MKNFVPTGILLKVRVGKMKFEKLGLGEFGERGNGIMSVVSFGKDVKQRMDYLKPGPFWG